MLNGKIFKVGKHKLSVKNITTDMTNYKQATALLK